MEALDAVGVVGTWSVSGEPSVDGVIAGGAAAASEGACVVVAVGGGSVLDAGKAIAAFACNPGDPLEHLEVIGRGLPLREPPLPVIAIPTTAGTGSEATRNAVLSSVPHRLKVSLRSPLLMPRVAIVDPELTLGLPRSVTASTGLDALVQLLEPFVCLRANPMTDALCREGLQRVGRALARVLSHPEDRAARAEMAWCSLAGGMALANAGLGAVHGFAGPIGGMFPIPHGAICAALAAPVAATNIAALESRYSDHPALDRYDEAMRRLSGDPTSNRDGLARWLEALVGEAGIQSLASGGLRPAAWMEVVAAAQRASSMKANPVALSDLEMMGILARESHAGRRG
jgi:alcohol dehydrogenase class IV